MPKFEVLDSTASPSRTSFITATLAPESVLRIDRLLSRFAENAPRISREIRYEPDLEQMSLRLANSLALSPLGPVEDLEEGVVLLGPHRLRVILYAWSLLRQKDAVLQARGLSPRSLCETVYVVSFLRYVGLDSRDAALLHRDMFAFAFDPQQAGFTELRELLMRDFFALLPLFDPRLVSKR
jgi:hypothetical protein